MPERPLNPFDDTDPFKPQEPEYFPEYYDPDEDE